MFLRLYLFMNHLKKICCILYNAATDSRRWSIVVAAVALSIVLGAALLAYVVDPHYRYRLPFFYDTVYYEIYATGPQILKSGDYDLFMLGTSMTRNFFLEDIDRTFNCRSIKFAASGGTMKDLKKFFDVALAARGRKLERVVLSLDIYPLNKEKPHWQEFEYMYRDDHKEDYRYLFSRQTFSSMLYLIKRKTSPKRQRPYQSIRNRMFATEYPGKPYGLAAVVDDAVSNAAVHHTQTPYSHQNHRKNLTEELLPMFDENPDIEFIVYLPPYHIYTYCQSEQFGEADALIRQRTEVMKELIKRNNVKLFDFQSDKKYVVEHGFFSDVQHFSNIAAKKILDDLKNGRRRITDIEAIEKNEKELRALISENMNTYYRHLNEFKEK